MVDTEIITHMLLLNLKNGRAPGWLSWLSMISAQVMISWFMGSSPALGSVLTVQSLLGVLSLPLSAPPLLAHMVHVVSLSQNK